MRTLTLFIVTTFATAMYSNAQRIGINETGNTPDASAILDVESTDKGFLPPRMGTAQRDAINNGEFEEGLTIFNTDVNCLQWWNGTGWYDGCTGVTSITEGPCAGTNDLIVHEGFEYRPVESDGKCWLDRNLGASQVATSNTDANGFGDMYQWGRAADGHQNRNSITYNAVISSDGVSNFNATGNVWDGQFILRNTGDNNWVDPSISGVNDLWQGVNGTNNPCPSGFRLPTEADWEAERLSWGSNDASGAFSSPLKLTLSGIRLRDDGFIIDIGDFGDYWSSTIAGANAIMLSIEASDATTSFTATRANGLPVRCIKQ